MLPADAHHAFFGFVGRAEFTLVPAQMASRSGMMPPAGVYSICFSSIRLGSRFLDVVGRGKVRLSGAEVRDIDSLRFELLRSAIAAAVGEIVCVDAVC